MKIIERKRQKVRSESKVYFYELMKSIEISSDSAHYEDLVISLVSWLRKKKYDQSPVKKLDLIIRHFKENPEVCNNFRKMLLHIGNEKDFTSVFTKVGILKDNSFFGSVSTALRHKIIPPLEDEKELNSFLQCAFHKRYDYRWIKEIPNNLWVDFFKTLNLNLNVQNTQVNEQIKDALSLLSYVISSLAFNEQISNKWKVKGDNEYKRVFMEQNRLINAFIYEQDEEMQHEETENLVTVEEINQSLNECETMLRHIEENSARYGTSFNQSHLIQRSKQQLSRIMLLVQLLDKKKNQNAALNAFVMLFRKIIERINKRNSIRDIYRSSTKMLAFQITEHKRESGEHYITTSRSEYYKFLFSAVKGGLVICVAALIKSLLQNLEMPAFWHYFLFGLNYATAFVFMYFIHGTLATKQPAVTAAALAASMDSKNTEVSGAKISIVFARVWRSQFASFIGNILTVLPISIGVAFAWNYFLDKPLLGDALNAMKTLRAQNFLISLALLYAAFTGVFLFLTGIINGYINNRVIHSNLPLRIENSMRFQKIFGKSGAKKVSYFVSKHLGATIGNVFLGMILGFAPLIGIIFGIPFDIRHITISTAFYAYSITDLNFTLSSFDWIYATLGVILIGFVNFMVSFLLAFYTAMVSRDLTINIVPEYAKGVLKMFLKYPLDFIFPPKNKRKPEDLFSKIKK